MEESLNDGIELVHERNIGVVVILQTGVHHRLLVSEVDEA